MPTHHEYLLMSAQVYEKNGGKPPHGWEILKTSDDYNCSKEGYFGCAYFNEATKELVIASRGCNDFSDVASSGLGLLFKQLPSAYQWANKFSNEVYNWANNNGYSITFTGHSLGAAHSEILAHNFQASAVNFESTGTERIICEKFGKINSSIEIINYLSDKNPCNSCDNHIGKILYVDLIPSEHKTQKKSSDDFYHELLTIGGNLLSCASGDTFKVISLLGIGLLVDHNINQVDTYHTIATWAKSFELNPLTGWHKNAIHISETTWLAKSRSGIATIFNGWCEGISKQYKPTLIAPTLQTSIPTKYTSTNTIPSYSDSFFPLVPKRKHAEVSVGEKKNSKTDNKNPAKITKKAMLSSTQQLPRLYK